MTSENDLRHDLNLLLIQWQKEVESARDRQHDKKPVPASDMCQNSEPSWEPELC